MIEALLNPVKEVHGVQVHALTLTDLASLITEYRTEMSTLLENGDFQVLILNSPQFIARIIGLAIKETDERLIHLPVGIQLDLLVTTWELSKITPEQLGKVIMGVMRGIQIMVNQVSPNLAKT